MQEELSREVHLKSRPVGIPLPENYEMVEVVLPEPGDGDLLVRNNFMSVDPYMRGRMIERKSYAPSFELGKVMGGGAVGQVIKSKNDRFQVGDFVLSGNGWREAFLSDGRDLTKIDPSIAPIQAYLGALGMPGLTAYLGLLDVGQLKEGETVFVSAAAGAVGSMACQIARIKGCRVIASAGSNKKTGWLQRELGVDSVLNYKETDDLTAALGSLAPEGIDVYFENVGGDHLEAALAHMKDFGRIVCCGMISQYNATHAAAAPRNLTNIVGRRLTLKGFIVSDHFDQFPRFYADMGAWLTAGQIKWEETIVDGLENAPEAFIGLFKGENLGKMLVRLQPNPAA